MKLYSFFRSGTSHRLRIALNLKGLTADYIAVNLRTEEHNGAAYKAINPQGLVPTLTLDDGLVLTQSPAIIEWLEETHPEPALLPQDPIARARVRALAAIIGCDIHPVNNRRILEHLRYECWAEQSKLDAWARQWIAAGFDAYEALLAQDKNRHGFSYGDKPGLADVYLIPQLESSRRFKLDMSPYPLISEIDANCSQIEAFAAAAPDRQLDAG